MSLTVERSDARPWADADLEPLFAGAFPAFITADQAAKAYVGRVREWFAGLNIILVEDSQIPVATGWAVPVQWAGTLPGPARRLHRHPPAGRRGPRDRPATRHPGDLRRHRAPAPLDPWLRTHWRLGGTIIATAPRSQTMTGTVAEWEAWTGMALPATGDYVIPRGLSILHIDTGQDRGSYTEPNVWVRHR